MPNALTKYAEARPTPRNKLMGLLADTLTQANNYATLMDPRFENKRQNQTLGLLADAVSLGSLAKTADRMSYGEPLTNAGKANVPLLKPETADALMMAPLSPRNALAMMGAGMDTGAAKAIFAGIGAKTADKAALAKAEKLAAAGADPKAIWRDTGWFKGGDGKWRFEIDDSAAQFLPSAVTDLRNNAGRRQARIFQHDQLTGAYPEAGDIWTTRAAGADSGSYTPGKMGQSDMVSLGLPKRGAPNMQELRGTNLHELQHAVQEREGFAKGGSPDSFVREGESLVRAALGQKQQELSAHIQQLGQAMQAGKLTPGQLTQQAQAKAAELGIPALESRLLQITNPDEAYRRLAGEAEARAVQSRMNLTPQQRRELFPLDSYDVPINSLVYR